MLMSKSEAIEHLEWLVSAANGDGDDGPLEGSDVEGIRALLEEATTAAQ